MANGEPIHDPEVSEVPQNPEAPAAPGISRDAGGHSAQPDSAEPEALGHASGDRFVWPPGPRPLSGRTIASPTDTGANPVRTLPPSPARPRAAPPAACGPPSLPEPAQPAARQLDRDPPTRWDRTRHAALEVERFWLGMTCPPLLDRVRASARLHQADSACPRCGGPVGPHEAKEDGCEACSGERLPWERMVRIGPYEGDLREGIRELKFSAWRRIGDELGRLLGHKLAEEVQRAGLERAEIALVPVPTTFRRRMSRGVDHSLVLARGMARAEGFEIVRALDRRHGPSQLDVPPSRRRANVAGVYRVRRHANLGGRVVVLVDDVRTSGATLRSCGGVLQRGVSRGKPRVERERRPKAIWAAVVGVTTDPDRRAGVSEPGLSDGDAL